jgi:hypothetical protein
MYIVIKEALGDTNTDTNFTMLLDADTLDKNKNNNTTTTTQSLGKRRRQERLDDFSDWPDNDDAGNFKRIPIKKRTTPLQGFYAGLENTNSRENGIFKANVVQPYPPVPQSGITHIGDRNALYTTGQLESGRDIISPVIRGDTDDMRVPNLTGNDFDNIQEQDRRNYGTYVPLTQQEERDLLANVKGGKRTRKTRTRKHKTRTRSAKKSKKNGRRRKTNIKRSYRKYK